ncbi:DUF2147 domain-containing protein [Bradyrhizobium sp. sGM-13]|uniref:DUF2147 domain-containing protein n=1 Tax=Bradyrhizobium sp. sGM-13 TaxID=2831781 RepID=UPI001BCE4B0C|nr:DUF2147 domain-containing protein [Bradyrhizobium sp. sGM-13]
MKQLCFLGMLMLLGSSAHAGAISFKIGGHRVHIESSRHCRSTSCTSMSVSRSLNWRHKRDRHDDDRDGAVPAKPAPQTVSPPVPPSEPPKAIVTVPPPAVYTPAASMTQIVAAPPPPPTPPPASPPAQQVSIPSPPPRPAKPAEAVQPALQAERVSRQAEEEPSDSPIGDWQTEGKGRVRIGKCGSALCGYVLNSSSNEKGEAILINMKPKTERQWTGGVYSQDSGETYYGTMSMKEGNTLRVEACALLRFYCSGNNWSRITRRADSLTMVSAEPRS